MRHVIVVPHNPHWRVAFAAEAALVASAIGPAVVTIHHIGSTAIPDIYAKPVIDLLVEVVDLEPVDRAQPALVALGYEAMGEFGLPGRRYFRKDNDQGDRTHHVHVFEAGSAEVERHLRFRDYLRAHPDRAQDYSNLKRHLAQLHPTDIEAYMDGKHGLIQELEQAARQWQP
jgi:GrpB-like predicted nucleotidyltransferase (UPF0157 family)